MLTLFIFTVCVDSEVTLIMLRVGPSVIVDGRDVTGAIDGLSPAAELALALVIELLAVGLPVEERLIDALERTIGEVEMLPNEAELNRMERLLANVELGTRPTLLIGAPALEEELISEVVIGDALLSVSLRTDEGRIVLVA